MTTDISGLVFTLRSMRNQTCDAAADALEAMAIERDASNKLAVQAFAKAEALADEVERLTSDVDALGENLEKVAAERDRTRADYETMKAHNKELFGKLSAAELERDRLKAALEKIELLEQDHWSDDAASICRKALGGDAS